MRTVAHALRLSLAAPGDIAAAGGGTAHHGGEMMADDQRCAVFDLDGTLAETAPDLVGALNLLLDDVGLPRVDPEQARRTAGMGGRMLIRYGHRAAGAPLDRAREDALLPVFLNHYEARLDAESHLYEGVSSTLDALATKGWRLSVCTNKPERLARILLTRLGVLDRFQALVGGDTLPTRKPDPAPLWTAIEAAGGARAHAVLIGDTITDRDAARNAGAPVALVDFGYATQAVASLAPDAIISRFRDVEAVVEQLVGAGPGGQGQAGRDAAGRDAAGRGGAGRGGARSGPGDPPDRP